jgi:hypothetical protein
VTRSHVPALVLAALVGCDRASPHPSAVTRPASYLAEFCVTEGVATQVGDLLSIDSPKFRAIAARLTDPAAELRFTYRGPTAETSALGSGRVRRQIGLKLRAQNGCNLVYAMWRLEPTSEVVVQVKRNPGQQAFAECENRGYRNVQPLHTDPVPGVAIGSTHVLRALLRGTALSVWADEVPVWEGMVGEDMVEIDGPVGLRTDNVRVSVAFRAGTDAGSTAPRPCRDDQGE